MSGFIDKKHFEHNGFKYIEAIDGYHIFRRQTGVKIETVKATAADVENGFIYKLIDNGLSRI